ncbi:major allergen Pru ar 1-like [Eucalyptus grandis]|uniref:major allergen Pru ar 1-like n=1 Tax=Eucalyptus grandis TaxID=71139 RepID=UPI00192ED108|nr:major allergen Pru ar 1-like [Eucalyptus grandis]
MEITSAVTPSRMFKALILNSHNILPKIAPEGIKSVEFIEREGRVGSIEQTNFGESSHIKYMKHKIRGSQGSGYVCKRTSEYHIQEGCELKEEDIKKGKDKVMGLYKAVEEYLMANPNVCAQMLFSRSFWS